MSKPVESTTIYIYIYIYIYILTPSKMETRKEGDLM